MQITELKADGLRREFRVVVAAAALDEKLNTKLVELQPQMHLKGFRPGKAPMTHLKRTFGKSLMSEIVQETVSETSQKALDEKGLRPAMQPAIKFENAVDTVIAGGVDLIYDLAFDLMPDFKPADPVSIALTRPVAEVSGEDVEQALKRLAEQQRTYEPRGDGEPAEKGDQLIVDFVGRIAGESFEGGSANDARLVLGSGMFLPGFEDQLIGAKAGEERAVNLTFPEDYGAKELAGKHAVFSVTVKDIMKAVEAVIDDEIAKKLGVESLETLRDVVKAQLQQQFGQASRGHLKRALLDKLDASHDFELPVAMVEAEFQQIWRQVEQDMKAGNVAPEDKDKSEDELKQDFRKIAARRVRLGLLLSEIGRINNVQVTQDEINRAAVAQARMYPGQEQKIMEMFRNNPDAFAQLRAPIYEEKVVDFLCTQIQITDRVVSREDLMLDPDELAAKLGSAAA